MANGEAWRLRRCPTMRSNVAREPGWLLALTLAACGGAATNDGAPPPEVTPPGPGAPTAGERPVLGEFGALPLPAPMPAGAAAEQAQALAAEVVGGGQPALPALLTALSASGIAVVADDGEVWAGPEVGARYPLYAWQVQAMAHQQGQGFGLRLEDLEAQVRSLDPSIAQVPLALYVSDALQRAAEDPADPQHFLASFLLALSAGAPPGAALSNPADEPVLGAVQTQLLLRELALGLAARARVQRLTTAQAAPALAPNGCRLSEAENTIADWTSLVPGLIPRFVDEVGRGQVPSEARIARTDVANILLAYAQLLYTLLSFDSEIRGPDGLQRKKEQQAGEEVTFEAHTRYSLDNLTWYNCIRPILNTAGLDFSVPPAGPAKGIGVEWGLREGTTRVEFVGDPLHNHRTDEAGVDTQRVQGKRRSFRLLASAKPEVRRGRVRADFTLKPADFYRDVHDAAPVALNPVAWAAQPAELLYRTNLLLFDTKDFEIRDWRNPGWSGTITISIDGRNSQRETVGDQTHSTSTTIVGAYHELRVLELEHAVPGPVGPDGCFDVYYSGTLHSEARERVQALYAEAAPCVEEGPVGRDDLERTENLRASGNLDTNAAGSMKICGSPTNRFHLDLPLGDVQMTGLLRRSSTQLRSGCPDQSLNGTETTSDPPLPVTLLTEQDSSTISTVIGGDQTAIKTTIPHALGSSLNLLNGTIIVPLTGETKIDLHAE